ncbi:MULTISPECIES: nucleoside hydrolase [unclassified Paenibacillus]|uniref:nucleoside hydrolase n=1 Tax=unclassified Paenibacillus TaxID=185978 RepID=UPI001C10C536|nr:MULTISPECIES: nucleoside hydrolase [unclassified Paenibacillus]MBU5445368.1 nucleoside hydrolase [Paenibacillus sp. MSJ-34]CAH0122495.1 Pyrimidine-specific ribonucleoside hydrolase RihA [Paenibacillus sp. CECT 9249]
MQNQKRLLLDVDTGVDDALAILYALKSPAAVIEGITTVCGNVAVEQATVNTLKVVELSGAGDIPVAQGAAKPLMREWGGTVTAYHGENGLGNYDRLPEPKLQPLEEHAADFIVRKVNERPHELTLVFVGRLTNLALALAKDPAIATKVDRLVLMGGALRAPGNVTTVAEANIHGDPEAAHRVFQSGMPITMVGLDVTMKAIFKEKHLEELKRRMPSQLADLEAFAEHVLKFRFNAYDSSDGLYGTALHDPLAVAVALDPNLVETEDHYITVETKGKVSEGATLADLRRPTDRSNASVCVQVDEERFIEQFIEVLCSGKGGA